jgi:hypothetical protein
MVHWPTGQSNGAFGRRSIEGGTLPRRGYQTAKRLWSDGIHFVRDATGKDRHPMRFVVGAHKVTASPFSRHASTLEEGIARAREATKMWLLNHHADAQHWSRDS